MSPEERKEALAAMQKGISRLLDTRGAYTDEQLAEAAFEGLRDYMNEEQMVFYRP